MTLESNTGNWTFVTPKRQAVGSNPAGCASIEAGSLLLGFQLRFFRPSK